MDRLRMHLRPPPSALRTCQSARMACRCYLPENRCGSHWRGREHAHRGEDANHSRFGEDPGESGWPPSVDRTGLTGTYDFNLLYSPDPARTLPLPPPAPVADPAPGPSGGVAEIRDPVPDLLHAVDAQLGLKLEPRKAPGGVLRVERYNRAPTPTERTAFPATRRVDRETKSS